MTPQEFKYRTDLIFIALDLLLTAGEEIVYDLIRNYEKLDEESQGRKECNKSDLVELHS